MSLLLNKIEKHDALIGIVGLGYVGLPLMLRFTEVGFKVVGFDIDKAKVDALTAGHSYIKHISPDAIQTALKKGFSPTTDYSRAREADALIICVPTPLTRHREPDLSYVIGTVDSLVRHLRKDQVISLESTTYPGTTDEELLPRIEKAGWKVGHDIFLVYSPEREDPGNPVYSTRTIPKICGGITPQCLEVGLALYGQVVDKVVPVSSTRAAEMTKLLENIHRAVNIGLVNELKLAADRMGLDIYEIIRAASTKPFGFVPYYPGPGLGGHCIPIDPFYLTWKAREYGVNTRFIELAGEVNSSMPRWVVGKIAEALNQRNKPTKGSQILLLGVAYKKNVDDVRESPAMEIMELLESRGAIVAYSDPHVPALHEMRHYHFALKSTPITPDVLRRFDCVAVITNHDDFDYSLIKQHARLIVDTRGVYQRDDENVVIA